jgi:DNA-binding transcriptional ArsR family regulator
MGVTKTEIFTDQQNSIARLAKALGHPARVAILQHMFALKTCICGDLVEDIGLAQATISQHLRELKNLGLIKGSIEGTSVCYCIDQLKWKEVKSMLSDFLNQKDSSKGGCC